MFESKSISVVIEDIKYDPVQPEAPRALKAIFFGFKGRINRKTYIWCMLLPLLFISVMWFAMLQTQDGFFGMLAVAMAIAYVWIYIAVMVKRLHDVDSSGWWILLQVIPVVWVAVFISMAVRPGTEDVNKYGQRP